MDILNNVNFDDNQAISIVVENVTTNPASGTQGRIIYNTTDGIFYFRNPTKWVPVNEGVNSVTAGAGITLGGTSTDPIINVNPDGITVEVVGNKVQIKDGGVGTSKLADLSVTTSKVVDGAITFAKIQNVATMTVLGRVTAGTGAVAPITILTDLSTGTNNSTLATSGAIKAYVDASIASIGTLIGGFDASVGTVFPGGLTTKKGDYWYVTAAGTIQGETFNIGDVIIANQANPTTTNKAHYTFLESNRDLATTTIVGLVRLATNQEILDGTGNGVVTASTLILRTATETRTGLAQKATDAEFNLGTENTKFVTSQQVKAALNALGAYSALIGNGSATSITVTHGLNTTNVVPALYRVSTGQLCITDIRPATNTTVIITFAKPPAANAFKIVLSST